MTSQDYYVQHQPQGNRGPAFADPAAAPLPTSAAAPGPAPTTAGPHRSDLLNKLDPRVDATAAAHGHDGYTAYDHYTAGPPDMSGRQQPHGGLHLGRHHDGAEPRASGAIAPPAHTAPAAVNPAVHGTAPVGEGEHYYEQPQHQHGQEGVPDGTFGPHRSRIANALDPRVDSKNPDYWRRDESAAAADHPGYAGGPGRETSGMAAGAMAAGGAVPAPGAAPAAERGEARRHHIGAHKTNPRHPEVFTIAHPNEPGPGDHHGHHHGRHAAPATGAAAMAGAAAASDHRHGHHGYGGSQASYPPSNAGAPASFGAAGYEQQRHGHHATGAPLPPGAAAPAAAAAGVHGHHPHHAEPRPGGRVPEGTYGPHASRVANALDPRVDSDLDGSRTLGDRFAGEIFAGTGRDGVPKGPVAGVQGQHAAAGTGPGGRVDSEESLFRAW